MYEDQGDLQAEDINVPILSAAAPSVQPVYAMLVSEHAVHVLPVNNSGAQAQEKKWCNPAFPAPWGKSRLGQRARELQQSELGQDQ